MPLVIESGRFIEFEPPARPVVVRGSRRALESIVANLLDNALKAEPKSGTILVRIRPGVTIEVVDHGEGVAPADRDLIFELFWRKSDEPPGKRLGLTIVKDLAMLHNEKIWVEETPGVGATFKLTLPELALAQTAS